MENTLPDDVVTFPRNEVVNRRPSSSRIQFHSNSHSLAARQARRRSEVPSSVTLPARRGSPLNPQKVHQAMELGRRPRSSQADMPIASTESSPRHRRRPSTGIGDTTGDLDLPANEEFGGEVGVFSDEYDLCMCH